MSYETDLEDIFEDWDTGSISSTAINGIFGYIQGEAADQTINLPTFKCMTSELTTIGAAYADTFTLTTCVLDSSLDSTLYTIRDLQDGGDGTTLLILEAQ